MDPVDPNGPKSHFDRCQPPSGSSEKWELARWVGRIDWSVRCNLLAFVVAVLKSIRIQEESRQNGRWGSSLLRHCFCRLSRMVCGNMKFPAYPD